MLSITKGPLTANGTLSFDLRGFFAHHFSFYPLGDDGAGITTLEAGPFGNVAVVQIIDPADGSFTVYTTTILGLHNIEVPCEQLDFVLTGATAPNLTIVLFPEPNR